MQISNILTLALVGGVGAVVINCILPCDKRFIPFLCVCGSTTPVVTSEYPGRDIKPKEDKPKDTKSNQDRKRDKKGGTGGKGGVGGNSSGGVGPLSGDKGNVKTAGWFGGNLDLFKGTKTKTVSSPSRGTKKVTPHNTNPPKAGCDWLCQLNRAWQNFVQGKTIWDDPKAVEVKPTIRGNIKGNVILP